MLRPSYTMEEARVQRTMRLWHASYRNNTTERIRCTIQISLLVECSHRLHLQIPLPRTMVAQQVTPANSGEDGTD